MITGTLDYLRRPFISNVRPGMKVLVVTDSAHDPRVWQVILATLSELGADAALAMFDMRPADYFDPPAAICEAMTKVDLVVLTASTGMLHAPSTLKAMALGVPVICMDGGMTLEMFQSGAVTEDQREMAIRQHNVATRIFGVEASECRVTSKYGTDFSYSVRGRIAVPPLPGEDFDPYALNDQKRTKVKRMRFLYPNGEFNVPPIEGTGEGKLVIDLCMHQLGRLYSPIELTVKQGRITSIDGGAEAFTLRRYLEEHGDENAYMCPAEASVGINAKARITGVQREDKNILGSMHFGLGTNIDVGGSIVSKIHMDGVILEPTLYVDGQMRMQDGKFLVPVDD